MSTIIITFVDLSIFIMEYIKHITLHQIDRFENITSTFSPENRSCHDDNMSFKFMSRCVIEQTYSCY
jgi:hypothetical protein